MKPAGPGRRGTALAERDPAVPPRPLPASSPLVLTPSGAADPAAPRSGLALVVFVLLNVLVLGYLVETLWFWPPRPPRQPHVLPLDVRAWGWDSWAGMLIARDFLDTPGAGRLYEDVFFRQGERLHALRERGAGRLYPRVFFDEGLKFQYPPTSLLAVDLVRALVPRYHPKHVLNAISLAAVLLWLIARDRPGPAGVAAGLLAVVKPHYAVLLLWGLLRRQWRFALAGLAAIAAVLAVSIPRYGLANHLDYLAVLAHVGRFLNQSVNGLLHRALNTGDALAWDYRALAPFHPAVFAGTTAASVLLLACALWPPRAPLGRAGRPIDLAIALLAATMASPVAWEHHYGVLLPVFALAWPVLARWPVAGRPTRVLLAASYVLASNRFYDVAAAAAGTPFELVQSYLLLAALTVLVILCRLRAGWVSSGSEQVAVPVAPSATTAPGPPGARWRPVGGGRVLVTGSTGFLGTAGARRLGPRLVPCDLTLGRSIRTVVGSPEFASVEAVVHCAAVQLFTPGPRSLSLRDFLPGERRAAPGAARRLRPGRGPEVRPCLHRHGLRHPGSRRAQGRWVTTAGRSARPRTWCAGLPSRSSPSSGPGSSPAPAGPGSSPGWPRWRAAACRSRCRARATTATS